MRLITLGVGFAAVLASAVASAAPQGGGAGGKGETGGKGGLGPPAGGSGNAEQGNANIDTSQQAQGGKSNPDVVGNAPIAEKQWEVAATFETHHLIRDQYLANAQLQTFNVLFASARYDLTPADTISLSGGGYQFFLADQTETGFRATDLSLSYGHLFELPAKLRLRLTGVLTAPVGYDSQLASNITSPSVSASISRRFGDLLLQANLRATYFWDRYSTADSIGAPGTDPSGQPNAQFNTGGSISAEYSMPFHRPLSAGILLTDSYLWYYNATSCPPGAASPCATTNPLTDGQPFQQSYGGEVFVRYLMPDVSGFKSDVTLALANGDPNLGYPSVLNDGVVHPYLLYYNTAEVYVALEGRY